MNTHQTMNEWLSALNPGSSGLALDRYGQCQLMNGNGICNVFVPASDSPVFALYADLWQMPEKTAPAALEELLALNILGMKAGGGVLGFDKQMRSLVYFYTREIGATNAGTFCTIVDNFFICAADMQKILARVFGTSEKAGLPARRPSRSGLHRALAAYSSC